MPSCACIQPLLTPVLGWASLVATTVCHTLDCWASEMQNVLHALDEQIFENRVLLSFLAQSTAFLLIDEPRHSRTRGAAFQHSQHCNVPVRSTTEIPESWVALKSCLTSPFPFENLSVHRVLGRA